MLVSVGNYNFNSYCALLCTQYADAFETRDIKKTFK